jgi:hypothetical protein
MFLFSSFSFFHPFFLFLIALREEWQNYGSILKGISMNKRYSASFLSFSRFFPPQNNDCIISISQPIFYSLSFEFIRNKSNKNNETNPILPISFDAISLKTYL